MLAKGSRGEECPRSRAIEARHGRDEEDIQSMAEISDFEARPSNVDQIPGMVRREVERWHGDVVGLMAGHLLSNPFVETIMRVEYPTNLRLPNIKTYVDRIDPGSHVNSYYGSMVMMGLSDAIIYRAFFSTLGGQAADWFKMLEPRFAVHKTQKKYFTTSTH